MGSDQADTTEPQPSEISIHLHDMGSDCSERGHWDRRMAFVEWEGGTNVCIASALSYERVLIMRRVVYQSSSPSSSSGSLRFNC
jgi:hypothetical protein